MEQPQKLTEAIKFVPSGGGSEPLLQVPHQISSEGEKGSTTSSLQTTASQGPAHSSPWSVVAGTLRALFCYLIE